MIPAVASGKARKAMPEEYKKKIEGQFSTRCPYRHSSLISKQLSDNYKLSDNSLIWARTPRSSAADGGYCQINLAVTKGGRKSICPACAVIFERGQSKASTRQYRNLCIIAQAKYLQHQQPSL